MAFIQLDRRFTPWEDGKEFDPDLWSVLGADGNHTWGSLLERKRVVVLAEAGSGKSTELSERAKILKAEGKAAFHATVQNVGRLGLEGALGKAGTARLAAWQASDQEAWFFIDSVDEAKLDKIRLDAALGHLSDSLETDLGRIHVILSGRHTDWEFRKDLARFSDALPIPAPKPEKTLTPDEQLARLVTNEGKREPQEKLEQPIIVIMAALDNQRIKKFAEAIGVKDLDAFMSGLDDNDLWSFARRPLDLQWLSRYWIKHGRFGSFADMLMEALDQRAVETDPIRGQRQELSLDRVRSALERVGASLVFGRAQSISIPDTEIVAEPFFDAIGLAEILPDWNEADLQRLARLPAFDPSTFGRARLHNDNEGSVRGYLAARWLKRLKGQGCPARALNDLLFADSYGERVIRPSTRETAAWAALWDPDVANQIVDRDPFVLLNHGDPSSLPAPVRTMRCRAHYLAEASWEQLRVLEAMHADAGAGSARTALEIETCTRRTATNVARNRAGPVVQKELALLTEGASTTSAAVN